ncbi:MAG TPA: 2-C-methyl-D-erythritol 4-phosphate cytidylyltransferase, partial [Sphingobium sp.]|nr:2-C-methyl-D-erythritol 4-phosphate cytidylyltransferase [Sphingobium sp.]
MTRGKRKIVALLVAAGRGSRAGGSEAKQFRRIAGKPMLVHAVEALSTHPAIDSIMMVVGAGQESAVRALLPNQPFVQGADSRRGSVRAGLEAIAAAGGADLVLIHDAARPFLPAEVLDRLIAALDDAPGAIPVLPVADTLVRNAAGNAGEVVDRDGLLRVQTPQAFRFDAILSAHRNWDSNREATDDAQMAREAGHA